MRFFIVQKEWSPKNECKYLAELCGTKLNVGALTNISQRLFADHNLYPNVLVQILDNVL